jgi:hypothetical protein
MSSCNSQNIIENTGTHILTSSQQQEWEKIQLISIGPFDGPPTSEKFTELKERKIMIKLLLSSLCEEGQAFIKNALKEEQKALKKEKKVKPKTKESPSIVAERKANAKEKQKTAQVAKDAKTAKLKTDSRNKGIEKSAKQIAEWFGIEFRVIRGEFEISLPEWLLDDEFLDEFDLDEGRLLLEGSDIVEVLIGASKKLAKLYFGTDFEGTFELDNLEERANTACPIGEKSGIPPWFECKTEPPLYEEILLSTTYTCPEGEVEGEVEGIESICGSSSKEEDEALVDLALSLLDSPLLPGE